MAISLKTNTASQEIALGPFLDATDGVTPLTGLTINAANIKLWKPGATSLVAKNSGGAVHMADGVYYCVLDATDTNMHGTLLVFIHVAGALPVKVVCQVFPTNVYSSLIDYTEPLWVDVQAIDGTIAAANDLRRFILGVPSSANVWEANIDAIKLIAEKLDSAIVLDAGVYQFTAHALE
ncbi:MAG: hypothetical protein ACRDD1_01315, partial [Planctomycetia bacterium]